MLTVDELLAPLAAHRRDEDVVVTTMSVVRPWGRLSSSSLDFASADSAMGHAADLALGIAMARPERRVICLNGDGSLLMSLGTLATIASARVANYRMIVVDNCSYEITGGQAVPAAGRIDYRALALGCGFANAEAVNAPQIYKDRVGAFLRTPGPGLLAVRVVPGEQGPISRSPTESSRYLQSSLYHWSRCLREALVDAAD